MPNFIQYSPWQDAASYGRGLGDTLAKILFELPQLKAQREMEQRKLGLEERRVASEEEIAKTHGKYYEAQAKGYPEKLELQNQLNASLIGRRQALNENAQLLSQIRSRDLDRKLDEGKARGENMAKRTSLMEQMQQPKMGLYGAQTRHLDSETENVPLSSMVKLLTSSIMAGNNEPPWISQIGQQVGRSLLEMQGGMPQQGGMMPPPQAQQQPMPSLMGAPPQAPGPAPQWIAPTGLFHGGGGVTGLRPQPPSPNHLRIRLRSNPMQKGWATPQEIQTNPDLEPIQE